MTQSKTARTPPPCSIMVSLLRSLLAPRDAAGLIDAHGRAAVGKAHPACANAHARSDGKAFRQAGRVREDVRRDLGRDALPMRRSIRKPATLGQARPRRFREDVHSLPQTKRPLRGPRRVSPRCARLSR